ncbi:hypothetical protein AB0C12_02355 [Actinoplanes sp. NPDC048967]|uniref:hypothetical protein n=1 Tax=Actinoplanes sp. NPDC048967 TaxID=3155269 RepID=UPI0033D86F6F
MRKLTEEEFKATTVPRPARLDTDEAPPFDFWPYFDAIPPADFEGHDFSDGDVPYGWTMTGTPYQHVLIQCETPDVFLVLVLDLEERAVAGHHLLDLNQVYGLA